MLLRVHSAATTRRPAGTCRHRSRPAPGAGRARVRCGSTTTTMASSSSRADAGDGARPSSSSPSSSPSLLAIGATGPTGRCAIDGLIAAGVPAGSILALTRAESGAGARALAERGVALAAADLDAEGGAAAVGGGGGGVAGVLARVPSLRAVYVHALSADAASADPRELDRARRLARQLNDAARPHAVAAAATADGTASAAAPSSSSRVAAGQEEHQGGGGPPARPCLDLVLYNSSAGRGARSGVSQIQQKQECEKILRDGCAGAGFPFLALQPAMFYEELWKRYTRPSVLEKGRFPFTVPPDVPVHLVAARDLGTAAAAALADPARFAAMGSLPLAGDVLSPTQMCAAFERAAREAAGGPGAVATRVTQSRPPAWLFWLLNRDLYRIVRFLSRPPGYGVDVAAARAAVPRLMTFSAFLRETGWADPSRSYEQGIRYDGDGVDGGGGLGAEDIGEGPDVRVSVAASASASAAE